MAFDDDSGAWCLTIADDLVAGSALDMAALRSVLVALNRMVEWTALRSKADTAGILLIFGVVETLLDRQSTGP